MMQCHILSYTNMAFLCFCFHREVDLCVRLCSQGSNGGGRRAPHGSQDAQIEQLYGAMLRGPSGQQRAGDWAGLGVSSPEGTKALSEGIHSLLEVHVAFIHQAAHHLLPVSPLWLTGHIGVSQRFYWSASEF